MEQFNMAKQMMTFQKAAYENYSNVLGMVHEQHQNILNMAIDQTTTWLPKEGKKAITDWLGQMNAYRSRFLDAVDENFNKFQGLFEAVGTPVTGSKAKKA